METSLKVNRQERAQWLQVSLCRDSSYNTFSSSPHSTGSMHIHSHMGICASLCPQTTHGLHESHPSQLQNRDRVRDLGETSALWLNYPPACWATPSFPVKKYFSSIFQLCSFSFNHLISQLGLMLAHTPLNFN